MKIKWLGHSCFKLSEDGYDIVIDPYNPKMFPNLKGCFETAHQVFCTHEHDDHNFREAITIIETNQKNPFEVDYVTAFHDKQEGKLRGKMILYIFKTKEYNLAHLGDLGSKLDKEQLKFLSDLDFLLIPVGGFFTIDASEAKEIVDILKPKVVIPMHYRGENFGFEKLAKLNEFTKYYDESEILYLRSNEIDLSKEKTKKILVFNV